MLADYVRGVAQNLGNVLERLTSFEQFRGEGVPETMRVRAVHPRGLEHRGPSLHPACSPDPLDLYRREKTDCH